MRGFRLTPLEELVLLQAANLYEAEPANFECDPDDARRDALCTAIEKLQRPPRMKAAPKPVSYGGNGMSPEQRRAVHQRWHDALQLHRSGRSYADIGREMGISGSRVSQICAMAERRERTRACLDEIIRRGRRTLLHEPDGETDE